MKIFKFERSQILPLSMDQAWQYFSNPLNLADITPPQLSLQIKGQYAGEIYNGMIINYTVKPLAGITMEWVSEIKHVNKPYLFVDEQRTGPYKFWYHQHFFKPKGKKVEIIDVVYYALPLGILANVLNHLIIKRKLNEIFEFRKEVLTQKFDHLLVAGSDGLFGNRK